MSLTKMAASRGLLLPLTMSLTFAPGYWAHVRTHNVVHLHTHAMQA